MEHEVLIRCTHIILFAYNGLLDNRLIVLRQLKQYALFEMLCQITSTPATHSYMSHTTPAKLTYNKTIMQGKKKNKPSSKHFLLLRKTTFSFV